MGGKTCLLGLDGAKKLEGEGTNLWASSGRLKKSLYNRENDDGRIKIS